MQTFTDYTHVIATTEHSAGNESVGNMWTQTRSFKKETPISEIIEWAKGCNGKLIITIDEEGADDNLSF